LFSVICLWLFSLEVRKNAARKFDIAKRKFLDRLDGQAPESKLFTRRNAFFRIVASRPEQFHTSQMSLGFIHTARWLGGSIEKMPTLGGEYVSNMDLELPDAEATENTWVVWGSNFSGYSSKSSGLPPPNRGVPAATPKVEVQNHGSPSTHDPAPSLTIEHPLKSSQTLPRSKNTHRKSMSYSGFRRFRKRNAVTPQTSSRDAEPDAKYMQDFAVHTRLETTLASQCALELFSYFIDALAARIERVGGHTIYGKATSMPNGSEMPCWENSVFKSIAEECVSTGLAHNVDEAYTVIIPAFLKRDLVPEEIHSDEVKFSAPAPAVRVRKSTEFKKKERSASVMEIRPTRRDR